MGQATMNIYYVECVETNRRAFTMGCFPVKDVRWVFLPIFDIGDDSVAAEVISVDDWEKTQ